MEYTKEQIRSAVDFMIDHNLRTLEVGDPTSDDREAAKARILRVLKVLDCSFVELATKFGWKPSARSAAEEPTSSEGVKP